MLPLLEPFCNWTLDALFPPRCTSCAAFCSQRFCSKCAPTALALVPPFCRVCAEPFDPLARHDALCATCREAKINFDCARAAWIFGGAPRNAIHRFKYRGKSALATRLVPALSETVRADATLSVLPFDWVVPVPLHARRERRRGFNQSELLARALAPELGVPFQCALERTRATPPQVGLSGKERQQNVRDAFALAPRFDLAFGARVLLVDDVFTTGATLRECAIVLKNAGAGSVCAVTLARHIAPDFKARLEAEEWFDGLIF